MKLEDIPWWAWLLIVFLVIGVFAGVGLLNHLSGFSILTGLKTSYCDAGCILGRG